MACSGAISGKRRDGENTAWKTAVADCFNNISQIIEKANSKHPVFRADVVKRLYKEQQEQLDKIKPKAPRS